MQREHHANVTQMDHAFGQLMRALDEQRLTDSTPVFFTSDNGPEGNGTTTPGRGSTDGLRGRKRDLSEGPDWWRHPSPNGGSAIDPGAAMKEKARRTNE